MINFDNLSKKDQYDKNGAYINYEYGTLYTFSVYKTNGEIDNKVFFISSNIERGYKIERKDGCLLLKVPEFIDNQFIYTTIYSASFDEVKKMEMKKDKHVLFGADNSKNNIGG